MQNAPPDLVRSALHDLQAVLAETPGVESASFALGSVPVEGGDQSVDGQSNDADVTQEQGNGNVNVSPAIAVGGDASTHNEQGNGNTAVAFVDRFVTVSDTA